MTNTIRKGLLLIAIGEIFEIIGSVVAFYANLKAITQSTSADPLSFLSSGYLIVLALGIILCTAALVLRICGIKTAERGELGMSYGMNFTAAFKLLIARQVVLYLNNTVNESSFVLYAIGLTVVSLLEMFYFIKIIGGIRHLAKNIEEPETDSRGKLFKLLLILLFLIETALLGLAAFDVLPAYTNTFIWAYVGVGIVKGVLFTVYVIMGRAMLKDKELKEEKPFV